MRRPKSQQVLLPAALVRRTPEGVQLTQQLIDTYLAQLRAQGRREDSVQGNGRSLQMFFAFLPPDKLVRQNSLALWRSGLLQQGYAVRTVNSRVSTVNALLESMGCRELQLSGQLDPGERSAPQLTRAEYLQMLRAARLRGDMRGYCLAKVFATTGIAVLDLPLVTVEAVRQGSITLPQRQSQPVPLPPVVQKELLAYAEAAGCTAGPIFAKRSGGPMARTQVGLYIQQLAQNAHVPAEKGNVSCLRQLHEQAMAQIEAGLRQLAWQAYNRQLEAEQLAAGWQQGPGGPE